MTMLSRPAAIDTIQRREVPACHDTQLPLKGYGPVTVYVQVTAEGVRTLLSANPDLAAQLGWCSRRCRRIPR